MAMTYSTREYQTMVDDLMQYESRLTDWERNFLDSISSWLAADIPLSSKQKETLSRIWEKY